MYLPATTLSFPFFLAILFSCCYRSDYGIGLHYKSIFTGFPVVFIELSPCFSFGSCQS